MDTVQKCFDILLSDAKVFEWCVQFYDELTAAAREALDAILALAED